MTDENRLEPKRADWRNLILSSLKPSRYGDIIGSVLWPALVALAILGFAQVGIATVNMALKWPEEVKKFKKQWVASFPVVKISNGVASTDEMKTVTGEIQIWGMGKSLPVMVDTTGRITEPDPVWTSGFLLTTSELVIRQTVAKGRTSDQRIPLKKINEMYGDLVLDEKGIADLAKKLKPQMMSSTFFRGFVRFALSKGMHVFMGTLITLIVTGIKKNRVKYIELVRLGFYALIPPVLIEAIILTALPLFPEKTYMFFFYFYITLYVGYIVLAALGLEKPEPTVEAQP